MRPWWRKHFDAPLPLSDEVAPDADAKPPAQPEHVAQSPMTDADRAEMWRRTAEDRRIDNLNLRDENDRLRADLALAVHARTRLVECGHEATLRRYDALLKRCRAEHVDRDEMERLRAENDALRYDARQPF